MDSVQAFHKAIFNNAFHVGKIDDANLSQKLEKVWDDFDVIFLSYRVDLIDIRGCLLIVFRFLVKFRYMIVAHRKSGCLFGQKVLSWVKLKFVFIKVLADHVNFLIGFILEGFFPLDFVKQEFDFTENSGCEYPALIVRKQLLANNVGVGIEVLQIEILPKPS